jgi:16S rRNA (guanine527-N7)-methyltransferase
MTVEQQLAAGVAALGLALPDGAEAKLLAYLALLDKWNRVYNLTAVRDAERMVSHHLLDSLAAVPYFGEGANDAVLDVGSGGGLPGIPLAIARPELQVTLIDSIAKKTAFLLQAKAELGLDNPECGDRPGGGFPPASRIRHHHLARVFRPQGICHADPPSAQTGRPLAAMKG